ncbi:MAG TPA: hypothetical protein VHA12_03260 [Candidatus Nanoarchaeia archaeon]|nr:hypothetical protein [Candidatus Nanoarchaeia archaeon]
MIIGVVGPIASGKNVLTDMLALKGFIRMSLSDEVREEARIRGLPIERKILQDIGNEMRLKNGNDYWANRLISKVEDGKNYVIEGIRNPGEVTALRKCKEFVLIAIDAPIEKRFQWIIMRGKDSDPHTLDEVKKVDARDRGAGEGEHGQQSSLAMQGADFQIINDSTKEAMRKKIDKILKKLNL